MFIYDCGNTNVAAYADIVDTSIDGSATTKLLAETLKV
jgi:hypothetical protein